MSFYYVKVINLHLVYELQKTLRSAELSIKNKDYVSCVMQCGTLMESALRDLLHLINKDGDLDEKKQNS